MSLFGLDELYNELLLEAKSPEEIKKILEYQFVQGKGVPQIVLDKIFEIDPTKKKTYTKWVLMQWDNEEDNIMQSLMDGHLQDMFKYFQERANNGLNLLGMKSFEEAMNIVPRTERDPIFTPIPENEKDDPKNDFDIVYDSSEWRIAVPHTWQADEKLGEGCRWCTAGAFGNGEFYFNTYSKSGPLWINFDKRKSEIGWGNRIEYPYTRYQFCFEHGIRGEMMDSRDNRINVSEMDIPQDVIDFYASKNPHYAEILTDDYDDEVVWERYANERYERTILLKEPVYGQYALRLMPTYNEDDPHVQDTDPYEMYNEDDDHDSIDGIQYPDETFIYDRCDGYAMVVMKSEGWNGNEEINIYFEDNNRRYGARWDSVTNAKVYETTQNGKFFTDELMENFYFVLTGSPYDVIVLKPFNGRGIIVNESRVINMENLPPAYQSGMWVEVEHSEGMFGLIYADPNTKRARLIVLSDRPTDIHFVAKKDERGYYIEGQFKKYWLEKLSDGDEGDGKQHLEISYFLEDKSYVIVKYENKDDAPRRNLYGLYDLKRQELILKDALDVEEMAFDDAVFVSYGGYSILYDYKHRKTLTRPFVNGRVVHNGPSLFTYVDSNTINTTREYYIYDDCSKKEHGPFEHVGAGLNNDNLVIVDMFNDNEESRIYNVDTSDIVSEASFKNITPITPYICKCMYSDNKCYILDTSTLKKICEIKSLSSVACILDIGPVHSVYVYETVDGKFNLISPKHKVLLPNNVDVIRNFGDNCDVIPFRKNENWFYLLINEEEKAILPSTQGIPLKNIMSQRVLKDYKGYVKHLIFVIDLDFKQYTITYSPRENKIVSIENRSPQNPNEPVSNEVISQIEHLFFPEKSQISEHFNNIFNRINNL